MATVKTKAPDEIDLSQISPDMKVVRHVVQGSLENSRYEIAGHTKPVTGPVLLKAISQAKLSSHEAERILGIPYGTLIRKAKLLGVPFNSNRSSGTRRNGAATKPANQYDVLPKAAVADVTPAKAAEAAPNVVAVAAIPEGAVTLDKVPDDGCEMTVGHNEAGKPLYCAKPGRLRRLKGGSERVLCDTHRAKLG